MDKFIGCRQINIDGRYNYMIRVHNTDVTGQLMNYLLLLDRVAIFKAGEEGFTEICHLDSNELVECLRNSFNHLEIYRDRRVGSREYNVLLLGVNKRKMWFAE